jgi:hypothetical protein
LITLGVVDGICSAQSICSAQTGAADAYLVNHGDCFTRRAYSAFSAGRY